jgi:hypothetical protein
MTTNYSVLGLNNFKPETLNPNNNYGIIRRKKNSSRH